MVAQGQVAPVGFGGFHLLEAGTVAEAVEHLAAVAVW